MRAYVGFIDASKAKKPWPIGWEIISAMQDSPIVHCFMLYDTTVYETTEVTFVERPLAERLKGSPVRLVELSKYNIQAGLTYSQSLVGKVYDYTGIAGLGLMLGVERVMNFILRPINALLGLKKGTERIMVVGNPLHLRGSMYCAASCVGAMRKMGVPLPQWWDENAITPAQLFEYIKARENVFNTVLKIG